MNPPQIREGVSYLNFFPVGETSWSRCSRSAVVCPLSTLDCTSARHGEGQGFPPPYGEGVAFFIVSRGYGPGKGFSSPCAVREQALPNYSLLKVCKTLMSIVYAAHQVLKVR